VFAWQDTPMAAMLLRFLDMSQLLKAHSSDSRLMHEVNGLLSPP
jgi:hypothetical protein